MKRPHTGTGPMRENRADPRMLLTLSCFLACTGQKELALTVQELGPARAIIVDSSAFDTRDIRRSADGGWWVLADAEPYLKRYDSTGHLLFQNGRHGRGPTDFFKPWRFLGGALGDGPPFVWDVARKQVLAVDTFGTARTVAALSVVRGYVRSDVESTGFGDPFLAKLIGSVVVFAEHPGNVGTNADLLRPILMVADISSGWRDTIVSFRDISGRQRVLQDATSLVPLPLWDVCPDSSVAVYDGLGTMLYKLRLSGDTIDRIAIPRVDSLPGLFSDDELEIFLGELLVNEARDSRGDTVGARKRGREILGRQRGDFPLEKPRFVRLLCSRRGDLWLEHFSLRDDALGFGRTWTLLDIHSVERDLRIPRGFRPIEITETELIGIMQSEDGARWPAFVTRSSAVP